MVAPISTRLPRLASAILFAVALSCGASAAEPLASGPPWDQVPMEARPTAAFAKAFDTWRIGHGTSDPTDEQARRAATAAMPLDLAQSTNDVAIALGALTSGGFVPAGTDMVRVKQYVAEAKKGIAPPLGTRRVVQAAPQPAPQAPQAQPEPQAQVEQPVSAVVADGLRKWKVRAEAAKASGMSADAKADVLARIAKLDDAIDAAGDIPALVAAAKGYGLIGSGVDYAGLLAAAKGGVAATPTAPAAAGKAPAGKAGTAAPTEELTRFEAGAKAKLYAFQDGTAWPPTDMPAAPLATVRLPGLDDVLPAWTNEGGERTLNHMINHQALHGQQFVAVEFIGSYYAKVDGNYAWSIEARDPATLYVDGRPVANSTWALPWAEWHTGGGNYIANVQPRDKRSNVATGVTTLSGDRYHDVRVVAYQRWRRSANHAIYNHGWGGVEAPLAEKWAPTMFGALLKVRVTPPDAAEPVIPKLNIEAPVRKPKRDE